MVQIILAASDRSRAAALAAGFKEETVLIKWNSGTLTNEENMGKLESEVVKLKPFQFLVSSYWGMGPD